MGVMLQTLSAHLLVFKPYSGVTVFVCVYVYVCVCVKVKLEEKQRARRRKREAAATRAVEAAEAGNTEEADRLKKESTITPVWFSKEFDQLTGSMMHVYKGGYWEAKTKQDWSHLPQIF